MGSERLSKNYLSNYFSHADTKVSAFAAKYHTQTLKYAPGTGISPLWLNELPVMQVSWPQAR